MSGGPDLRRQACKQSARVGFVGLGNMGGGIAERIRSQGWRMTVWDRSSEATAPFATAGCKIAANALELGAACDFIGLCVRNDADVDSVLLGDEPGTGVLDGMSPGGVVAVHSTVAPETVIALEAAARERGIWLLDAPVSSGYGGGGRMDSLRGTMTVMVGGASEALEAMRPILQSFTAKVVLLGPVGAGQTVKLINNGVCFANMKIAIDALTAARQLGFDWKAMAEVMRVSSGGSVGLDTLFSTTARTKMASASNNIGKDVGHLRTMLDTTPDGAPPFVDEAAVASERVRVFAGWLDGAART